MNVIELGGCAPQPLARYLKALGILRLVAEQKDPAARGWWRDEQFFVATSLDEETLLRFLLLEYEPTPLVSPWIKGAGFFRADDPGLVPLERSSAARFGPFRGGIAAARSLLSALARADATVRMLKCRTKKGKGMTAAQVRSARALKDDPEFKKELAAANRAFAALKEGFIPDCRLTWRGRHRQWMDAAVTLDGQNRAHYPALLGTGGNDGRLDFTNNFMQRLGDLFDIASPQGRPRPGTDALLSAALKGHPGPGLSQGSAIGQYNPGSAGGANSTTGPAGASLVNPWDFVLMLEGTVLFATHAARRLGAQDLVQAAAPFAIRGRAAGYGNSAAEHEKAGRTDETSRGEQWMPLWPQPLTLAELQHVLAEGRATLGRAAVREPLDFARAIARLGVARGLSGFERYGYLERNGQSNLAVPLGRIRVPVKAEPRLSLLDDLDAWLSRVRREARGKNAPARLQHAEKRLADALFAVIQHTDEPARWQGILTAMVDVEGTLASGSGFAAGPIRRLQPGWVTASDDGTAELRLATALGLANADLGPARHPRWGPIRRHAIPLSRDGTRFDTVSEGAKARLVRRAENVMLGRDPIADCLALVMRRLTEASQGGLRHLPLAPAPKAGAHVDDLALLTSGGVDLTRTLRLARAFMALDCSRWALHPAPPAHPPRRQVWPDDGWIAVRLALLPWPLDGERDIGADSGIVRRLSGGDAAGAVAVARRRLEAKGVVVPFTAATTDPATARVWAAALAFPITRHTAKRLCSRLAPSIRKETADA